MDTLPPLGGFRACGDLTCGWGVGPPLCSKKATWHIFWSIDDDGAENSVCCDEHMEIAKQWIWYDRHPISSICTMPFTAIIWSWEDAPGRCVLVVDEETFSMEAEADRELELIGSQYG